MCLWSPNCWSSWVIHFTRLQFAHDVLQIWNTTSTNFLLYQNSDNALSVCLSLSLFLSEKYWCIWFYSLIIIIYVIPVDVVNANMFYLVIISDTTNEFLPGDYKDLQNWIKLNTKSDRAQFITTKTQAKVSTFACLSVCLFVFFLFLCKTKTYICYFWGVIK